jgi:hypothetical protein
MLADYGVTLQGQQLQQLDCPDGDAVCGGAVCVGAGMGGWQFSVLLVQFCCAL